MGDVGLSGEDEEREDEDDEEGGDLLDDVGVCESRE